MKTVEAVKAACETFIKAAALEWEWDERFGAALAALKSDRDEVRAALSVLFDRAWSASDIADAPASVKEAADEFGGLREGQLFWASLVDETSVLYCAWWPWGGGGTVSIRISSNSNELEIKTWFGL